MSVLDSVKSAIGVGDEQPRYRCQDCGQEFASEADTDSYWFGCPECDSDDIEQLDA